MRTAPDWLAIPEDELGVKLAKVLNKKPWEHDWFDNLRVPKCSKCGCDADSKTRTTFCSVPDRIKLDWKTAMEWRDKTVEICGEDVFWCELENVIYQDKYEDSDVAMVTVAQPKHYLIAAAMVVGRKEE